jgi:hypothetical protein
VAKNKHKSTKRADQTSRRQAAGRKWSAKVKTASTFPPEELYTKEIARQMASKKVSPKGLGSAIRMVQFYINRAGKNLSATRKRELEKAKHILQEKNAEKNARSKTRRSSD